MRYLLWIVLIFLLAIRFVYFYKTQRSYPNGTKVRITDRISSEPIRYEKSQYLKLHGLKIYLPLYPEITYGDRVVIEGLVEKDKLKEAKLVSVSENENYLYLFRENIINFYHESLPQPHSALVAGTVVGSKSDIQQEFWESLKKSGTAHVVVASGMNVSLVAGFLISILAGIVNRKKALIFSLIGVWVYAIFAGFDAPIIRAAIMGSIAFSAQELGRLGSSFRALLISAAAMLLINPGWISDLGFILSFAATLSLILFESKVRRYVRFMPSLIKEGFSTSFAAQILIAPILFFTFGQFNILSPFINALVLWTIPYITIIGMIGGVAGLIVPPVGKLILYLTYPLTSWFTAVIQLF
ncbi:hypothetical protein A2955_05085 [Candidatus Woesebacteria bacterium RIFCSPLOWO2_01_FULL_37_19]|uniref:ComEC/Rec2-related protein domain-containing protein n=2 Tax=Candidatus Woeseibacteriota TaxID=1752722 RepID=A0A1F8B093_9BACT|nr:MAG: hypothetical protein A2771_03290 [Candidatus Woesebacteria bacterium RIFCSPHIGHO2_01_FULL_38_26b]OGM57340.1 MAG: hypothetical protein A2955_05085 [Candidatus Woesebacteria bacterium RIFCSPLOWO2_01_FULL_37_19]